MNQTHDLTQVGNGNGRCYLKCSCGWLSLQVTNGIPADKQPQGIHHRRDAAEGTVGM